MINTFRLFSSHSLNFSVIFTPKIRLISPLIFAFFLHFIVLVGKQCCQLGRFIGKRPIFRPLEPIGILPKSAADFLPIEILEKLAEFQPFFFENLSRFGRILAIFGCHNFSKGPIFSLFWELLSLPILPIFFSSSSRFLVKWSWQHCWQNSTKITVDLEVDYKNR